MWITTKKEITEFKAEKLLIIRMTDNLTARNIIEEDLKFILNQRNIKAIEIGAVLEESFTEKK